MCSRGLRKLLGLLLMETCEDTDREDRSSLRLEAELPPKESHLRTRGDSLE